MNFGKKEFLAGVVCAALATTPFIHTDQLQALTGKPGHQNEMVFASKLGLLSNGRVIKKTLASYISGDHFYFSLSKVLHDTGIVKTTSRKELVDSGIMPSSTLRGPISRKEASEAILRSIVHAWHRGILPTGHNEHQSVIFRDWSPETKYRQALDFAFSNSVIQGHPDGSFRPAENIRTIEAIRLMKRLHDLTDTHSSASRMGLFADVPQDHFMTRPLLNLRKAGAFDKTNLEKKLNGTGNIRVSDLSLIFEGILQRLDRPGHVAQLKRLQRSLGNSSWVTRTQLARMAEILVIAVPHEKNDSPILYSDVKPRSSLAQTLERLSQAGIRMGYNNNRFAGNERISRYEALGLLNSILKDVAGIAETETDVHPVTSEDRVERLKNILINKRERVRRILNRD